MCFLFFFVIWPDWPLNVEVGFWFTGAKRIRGFIQCCLSVCLLSVKGGLGEHYHWEEHWTTVRDGVNVICHVAILPLPLPSRAPWQWVKPELELQARLLNPPILSQQMHLPPFAMTDHQAVQLSTRISIWLRLGRAPGTIYKANREGSSPYGGWRTIAARETSVNRKMLCSNKTAL